MFAGNVLVLNVTRLGFIDTLPKFGLILYLTVNFLIRGVPNEAALNGAT